MRILVLGGTLFLGRHGIDAALARCHDVTLFHRGKTGTDLYPEVERVLGDRDGGLAPLSERSFDAVVDTSGYVPRIVEASASLLPLRGPDASCHGHPRYHGPVTRASFFAAPLLTLLLHV